MTACCRPAILRDTLASFSAHFSVNLCESTLYVNVDPVPIEVDPAAAVAVCEEFFGRVVCNLPNEPSFPKAVKWCWAQPRTRYFMSCEDDWLLTQNIDVGEMAALLDADPALSVVNLRVYSHDDDRICLAPGLWRAYHAAAIADRLVEDANPERQLRPRTAHNPHGGKHQGFKGMQYPRKLRVMRDIGRVWMAQMPYEREKGREFTRWVRT